MRLRSYRARADVALVLARTFLRCVHCLLYLVDSIDVFDACHHEGRCVDSDRGSTWISSAPAADYSGSYVTCRNVPDVVRRYSLSMYVHLRVSQMMAGA